jgi:hypothetical protein
LIKKIVGIILNAQNQLLEELDFERFAHCFCSFAMLGRDEMIKIVFNSIDNEGYGHIRNQGYIKLLKGQGHQGQLAMNCCQILYLLLFFIRYATNIPALYSLYFFFKIQFVSVCWGSGTGKGR